MKRACPRGSPSHGKALRPAHRHEAKRCVLIPSAAPSLAASRAIAAVMNSSYTPFVLACSARHSTMRQWPPPRCLRRGHSRYSTCRLVFASVAAARSSRRCCPHCCCCCRRPLRSLRALRPPSACRLVEPHAQGDHRGRVAAREAMLQLARFAHGMVDGGYFDEQLEQKDGLSEEGTCGLRPSTGRQARGRPATPRSSRPGVALAQGRRR